MHSAWSLFLVSLLATQQAIAVPAESAWGNCGDYSQTSADGRVKGADPNKTCPSGYSCTKINDWYWQCTPSGGANGGAVGGSGSGQSSNSSSSNSSSSNSSSTTGGNSRFTESTGGGVPDGNTSGSSSSAGGGLGAVGSGGQGSGTRLSMSASSSPSPLGGQGRQLFGLPGGGRSFLQTEGSGGDSTSNAGNSTGGSPGDGVGTGSAGSTEGAATGEGSTGESGEETNTSNPGGGSVNTNSIESNLGSPSEDTGSSGSNTGPPASTSGSPTGDGGSGNSRDAETLSALTGEGDEAVEGGTSGETSSGSPTSSFRSFQAQPKKGAAANVNSNSPKPSLGAFQEQQDSVTDNLGQESGGFNASGGYVPDTSAPGAAGSASSINDTATEEPGGKLVGTATSSHYIIDASFQGSCGCKGTDWQAPPSGNLRSAAVNTDFYGGDTNKCGTMCGRCFKLTSTGGAPDGQGAPAGQPKNSMYVRITDSCPKATNQQWCMAPNKFGFKQHFDIAMVGSGNPPLGWENPIVRYESMSCSQAVKEAGGGGGGAAGAAGNATEGEGEGTALQRRGPANKAGIEMGSGTGPFASYSTCRCALQGEA